MSLAFSPLKFIFSPLSHSNFRYLSFSFYSLLQTERFVHTLKDELVKSALLALHTAQPGYVSKNQKQTPVQAGQHQGHIHQRSDQNQSPVQGLPGHSPATSVTESTVVCNNVEGSQTTTRSEGGTLKHQDSIPHHKEYDEEEWVSQTLKTLKAKTSYSMLVFWNEFCIWKGTFPSHTIITGLVIQGHREGWMKNLLYVKSFCNLHTKLDFIPNNIFFHFIDGTFSEEFIRFIMANGQQNITVWCLYHWICFFH